MVMKKRGQITIFIIIGIFILVITGVYFYLTKSRFEIAAVETIPEEYAPVKNYVEECIGITAQKGVVLMGVQGGYIYLPTKINANPRSYIDLVKGGTVKTPYWYYEGQNRIPTIDLMQEQLARFVSENLNACLDDFRAIEEKFTVTKVGNISTRVTIAEKSVAITVNYPLEAGIGEEPQKVKISIFDAVVNVKLRRVYEFARKIYESENNQMFLEDVTIDLMTLGPQIPFTDIVFTCRRMRWYKNEVEDDIKKLLYYNLPRIRFANTDYIPFEADDVYGLKHFLWATTNEVYADLKAGVLYQKDWNFDMNVRPSHGNIMDASFGRGNEKYLQLLCINIFHFTYDIIYPVQIVIRDEESFNEGGFVFRFALPVMINHNQGDRGSFGIDIFETPSKELDYCDEKLEEETAIYAKDAITLYDLKDANLTFNCLNSFYCDLGKTAPDGGVYRLRTKLPSFCFPGSVVAEKEGYLKATEPVPRGKFMDVYMTPLKKINFRVIKRRASVEKVYEEELLEEGEKVIVSITYENETEYAVYRQYPFEKDLEDIKTVELIMGDVLYDLDLILLDKNNKLIGGYRGKWKADYDEVQNSNEVIFQVMEIMPHPVSDSDQAGALFQIQDTRYSKYFQPLFR